MLSLQQKEHLLLLIEDSEHKCQQEYRLRLNVRCEQARLHMVELK